MGDRQRAHKLAMAKLNHENNMAHIQLAHANEVEILRLKYEQEIKHMEHEREMALLAQQATKAMD
jgi:hypothetical protein